jgi:hypothetical protein
MLQFTHSLEEVAARVKKLDSLQIALRTQPHSFVARFLEVSLIYMKYRIQIMSSSDGFAEMRIRNLQYWIGSKVFTVFTQVDLFL